VLARIELLRTVAEQRPIRVTGEVFAGCTAEETLDSQLIRTLKEEGKIIVEPLADEDRALFEKLRADFKLGQGWASCVLRSGLSHPAGQPPQQWIPSQLRAQPLPEV